MRTFYYKMNENFGDHINSWLWPRLFPDLLCTQSDEVLIGIGTLISSGLNHLPGTKIIFGTGTGYGAIPGPAETAQWRFYFVRGPLTARVLGLTPDKAITDGAWLIDQLPDTRYRPRPSKGVVFVPHYLTDLRANWRQPCEEAGIRYVSPLDPEPVLDAIAGAELAIVESMHGAIVADYYRVPWIPVASDGRVLAFKWLDFCMSIGVPFKPVRLPPTDIFDRTTARTNARSTQVEYLPPPHESDFREVRYGAPKPPNLRQLAMPRLKPIGRSLRSAGMAAARRIRSTPAFRNSFSARSNELAQLLQKIAREPATLSRDDVRAKRIEQLSERVEQLRRDYGPSRSS